MSERHKRLNQYSRYMGDLKNDVILSEGNTKTERLVTIKKIYENWNKFIKNQLYVKNLYEHKGVTKLDNPTDFVNLNDNNIFDEPYTLWLNQDHYKWLKTYPCLIDEIGDPRNV